MILRVVAGILLSLIGKVGYPNTNFDAVRAASLAGTFNLINHSARESPCQNETHEDDRSSSRVQTDVLYSWQRLPDVLEWSAVAPTSQLFQQNYLYAWRTPAATFGYGDVPIRIKLKAGVIFKDIPVDKRNCVNFSENERATTVYTSHLSASGIGTENTLDYILCSPKVISSWSFGTKEGLEEVKKDFHFNSKHPGQGDIYGAYDPEIPNEPFGRMDLSDSAWTVGELQNKIKLLSVLAKTDVPRVFCVDGTNDCQTTQFTSQYPAAFRSTTANHTDNYPSTALRVHAEDKTVYIDATAFKDDLSLPYAEIVLKNEPSLKIVVVSNESGPHLVDLLSLFPGSTAISFDQFQRIAVSAKKQILTISPNNKLDSKNSVNFGPNQKDKDDGFVSGNDFLGYILKLNEALIVGKVSENLFDSEALKYLSNIPLVEVVKMNGAATISYYSYINGFCRRTILSQGSDGNPKETIDPSLFEKVVCDLHR